MKFIVQCFMTILLILLLFFNLFVSSSMNKLLLLAGLSIFLILSIIIFGYRKPISRGLKEITLYIMGICSILMISFYLFGFLTGFDVNYSVFYQNYIDSSVWLTAFFSIVLVEVIRYVFSQVDYRNEKKRWFVTALLTIVFVIVDLSITPFVYDFTNFTQVYEFFALVVVQSVSKNVFLNFLTRKHGYWPCFGYRIIMDLYVYFIPVTPKLNVFIEAVILLVFPYILYLMLLGVSTRTILGPARKDKKKNGISTIFFAIVFAVLVMLVSREFTYSMIAVGSGSMTGTINKGDAIIYKRFEPKKEVLNAGDIIVFKKNGMLVVHRIEKVFKVGLEKYTYQTKGDANDSVDNWLVETDDVVGTVKLRVLWIAWPSVLLNEIF